MHMRSVFFRCKQCAHNACGSQLEPVSIEGLDVQVLFVHILKIGGVRLGVQALQVSPSQNADLEGLDPQPDLPILRMRTRRGPGLGPPGAQWKRALTQGLYAWLILRFCLFISNWGSTQKIRNLLGRFVTAPLTPKNCSLKFWCSPAWDLKLVRFLSTLPYATQIDSQRTCLLAYLSLAQLAFISPLRYSSLLQVLACLRVCSY